MKNNIKKTPVKFREVLLYFQHFMLILSLPQISDYHHLKASYAVRLSCVTALVHVKFSNVYVTLILLIILCLTPVTLSINHTL